MSHLSSRFSLIPFSDLADIPEDGHHAVGSPYFNTTGTPLYPDPIVVAIRDDIVSTKLPHCTALGVSCNTRPYHSYGPVIRAVIKKAEIHKYPNVRLGLEGVMDVGHVKVIEPGSLSNQTDRILLGCVATMTAGTNEYILKEVLENFSMEFSKLPPGSTLRMPLIGTGKAFSGKPTEKIYKDVVDLTVANFYSTLLPPDKRTSIRRLLLVHPFEYESQLILNSLAEKAVFLSILDKLGLHTTDKRCIYGIGHGETPENQFVDKENFKKAIDYFDDAIDKLLGKKKKECLKTAARGAEIEPALSNIYIYIYSLAIKRKGLLDSIIRESFLLASEGRLLESYCVADIINSLGGGGKYKKLLNMLRDSYIDFCVAALEGRLLYENYIDAKNSLIAIKKGVSLYYADKEPDDIKEDICRAPKGLVESTEKLDFISEKIPKRIIENTFHIVIRKFMANQIETVGAERAINNLLELKELKDIDLNNKTHNICLGLLDLVKYVEKEKENSSPKVIQKYVLDKLLEFLPDHGSLRLEAARYYLRGEKAKYFKSRIKSISKADIQEAWQHLEIGQKLNPRDYGILSYIGFLMLTQGAGMLSLAQEFFMLFHKVIEYELSHGRYGISNIKFQGEEIKIPIKDYYIKEAYDYYQKYRDNTQNFYSLAKALAESEGSSAISLYHQCLHGLRLIGRYDLAILYESILGETWIALMSKGQQTIGSIPLPFGEISIDFLVNIYKKIRRWFKYRKIRSLKIRKAMKKLIKKIDKKIKHLS